MSNPLRGLSRSRHRFSVSWEPRKTQKRASSVLFSLETSEAAYSVKLTALLPVPLSSLPGSPAWNDRRLCCPPGCGNVSGDDSAAFPAAPLPGARGKMAALLPERWGSEAGLRSRTTTPSIPRRDRAELWELLIDHIWNIEGSSSLCACWKEDAQICF